MFRTACLDCNRAVRCMSRAADATTRAGANDRSPTTRTSTPIRSAKPSDCMRGSQEQRQATLLRYDTRFGNWLTMLQPRISTVAFSVTAEGRRWTLLLPHHPPMHMRVRSAGCCLCAVAYLG